MFTVMNGKSMVHGEPIQQSPYCFHQQEILTLQYEISIHLTFKNMLLQ